jgi:hypothetical protein
VQAGQPGERAWTKRAAPGEQVEAIEIDVAEIETGADAVVEQRELIAEIAERELDGSGEPPATPSGPGFSMFS